MKKETTLSIFLTISIFLISTSHCFAQSRNMLDGHPVTHVMNEYELSQRHKIGLGFKGTAAPTAPIINIAEFQPMQGVLVRYPLGIPVELVAQMSQLVKVTTLVADNYEKSEARSYYQENGVNMQNTDFLLHYTDTYWTRDYGPWFIIDGNDEFGIVDFIYNRPRPGDDGVMEAVADYLDLNYFAMDMVHTGGNYMTDGYGTAASTTLLITENPNENATSLRTMAQEYLGIGNYYLIQDPMQEYIEHIDCWGKFLDVDKIVITQVPESDDRYQDYEDVANFFANATTPWGNHYQVYRTYTPAGWYDITPYTNSLILNDHVFIPVTGNNADEAAIAVYENAMPGYTIVPVEEEGYYTPWENTDALHCRTHEIADLGMLLIRHYPVLGNQPHLDEVPITADITAYSGQNLIADSILIYYRIDSTEWQTTPMQHIEGKQWQGFIPTPTYNCVIEYYIEAKDASGRTERHPYIGAADPHLFNSGAVGIASLDQHPITMFPNPARNAFFVRANDLQLIEIYNQYGQLIDAVAPNMESTTINCTTWPAGIYIVRCQTQNGKMITKKVSITK